MESLKGVPVQESERISRYIGDASFFYSSERRLKPAGFKSIFIPPKSLRVSVYRTDLMDEQSIWAVAKEYIDALRKDGKKMIARIDIKAKSYYDQNLDFDPNGVPHDRHADVIKWPEDRADQKAICTALANLPETDFIIVDRPEE